MKLYFLVFLFIINVIRSQHTGSITGRVLDRNVQYPISFCTVQLSGQDTIVVETDSLGYFLIQNIPVGQYKLKAFTEGYKPAMLPIIIEQSIIGKVNLYMEEDITQLENVVIYSDQDQPYKVTSGFQFKAKDFAKSSASFGDPSRLVQTLPAVVTSNDGNNQVSVRGNSPFNNNWYIEGIEIPDPNHFGGYGSNGGFISIFNENTLEQFDFYLGAYPAMYGNSNSSVFDMKMRSGNTKKREQNIRISPLGVYAGAEGYFKKGSKANYIFNGRIFDLYFFNKWGIVPKENFTIPSFKDFSYKISCPSKNDRLLISFFGFGGNNSLSLIYNNKKEIDRNKVQCHNLSFQYKISPKTLFHTTIQYSFIKNSFQKSYPYLDTTETSESVYRSHSYIQYKHNARFSLRVGARFAMRYIQTKQLKDLNLDSLTGKFFFTHDLEQAQGQISEAYASSIVRCSEYTKLVLGLHVTNVSFNKIVNWEPRLGISFKLSKKYDLSFSSGLYSKIPSYYVYKYSGYQTQSVRSLHLVNAHIIKLDTSCTLKSEIFYQYLWNAYLLGEPNLSNASLLNLQNFNFHFYNVMGKPSIAQNYGIDLVLKKAFPKNYSLSFSGAIYRSLYLDGTDKWRNTAFDNQFSTSIQASKEKIISKNYGIKSFILSAKALYFGGFYEVPIDYNLSIKNGGEWHNNDLLFTQKLPNYFRLDLGAQISYSRKNIKHEIRFDIQNSTNRKNVLRHYFDTQTKQIKALYQLPIIPVISYTAYF